ncbi:hypothetical protein OUZ56_005084 [Daphnia magna]|uniref:Uncharacterized protein n=1 Tax=Daphnia magna TaxID=35525 RepID=A0ABQ9YRS2_9CRUS|nr:hypothetical protein OUZ56_005084 [Daphnia magna]
MLYYPPQTKTPKSSRRLLLPHHHHNRPAPSSSPQTAASYDAGEFYRKRKTNENLIMSRCGAAVRFVFPSNPTLQHTNPSQMAASLSPHNIHEKDKRIFTFTTVAVYHHPARGYALSSEVSVRHMAANELSINIPTEPHMKKERQLTLLGSLTAHGVE